MLRMEEQEKKLEKLPFQLSQPLADGLYPE